MNDKLNITIRIANQAPIAMAINRDDEERMRKAEYNVNRLWNSWSQKYSNRTPTEVLAMVAFRFAELYLNLNEAAKNTEDLLADFEQKIDNLLTAMNDADASQAALSAASAAES